MTLQEAIDGLKKWTGPQEWGPHDVTHCGFMFDKDIPRAIATILNAVVKGELREWKP